MAAHALWKSLARRALAFVPHRHDLGILARKHGTDKYANGYVAPYQHHFRSLRRRRLNVLEIGVGGGPSPERGGASLRMWRDYFPRSRIYGIDIYDKSAHEDRRIRIFRGDQNDPDFLRDVAERIGLLDVVVDDGSHVNEHVQTTFRTLFRHVRRGGYYVVEDLCTAYWPEYGGDWRDLTGAGTSMSMLKRMLDGLHYSKIPNYAPAEFDREIVSLHFYPSIAFVHKGDNRPRLTEIDRQVLEANRLE